MVLDAVSNFVRGNTDAEVGTDDTTVSVDDASIFPDPETDGEFNVVIWDVNNFPRPDQDGDVEILRVTERDTDTNELTVTRGQEMTSAAAHPEGSAIHLSPTAKMFSDIESTFGDFWDAGTQELTADVNNTNTTTTALEAEEVGSASNPVQEAYSERLEIDGKPARGYDHVVRSGDDIADVINNQLSEGESLFIDSSEISYDTTLTPPDSVKIAGRSKFNTFLNYEGDDDFAFTPPERRMQISNLTINGNENALHGIGGPSGVQHGGTAIYDSIRAINFPGDGIHLQEAFGHYWYNVDSRFNDRGAYINSIGSSHQFIGCRFTQNDTAGIKAESTNDIKIFGGDFSSNPIGIDIEGGVSQHIIEPFIENINEGIRMTDVVAGQIKAGLTRSIVDHAINFRRVQRVTVDIGTRWTEEDNETAHGLTLDSNADNESTRFITILGSPLSSLSGDTINEADVVSSHQYRWDGPTAIGD